MGITLYVRLVRRMNMQNCAEEYRQFRKVVTMDYLPAIGQKIVLKLQDKPPMELIIYDVHHVLGAFENAIDVMCENEIHQFADVDMERYRLILGTNGFYEIKKE